MRLFNLLSGASLGVLAFAAFELPALGQEQLPPIEIGKAKPVAAHGGKGSGTKSWARRARKSGRGQRSERRRRGFGRGRDGNWRWSGPLRRRGTGAGPL